MNEPLMKEMLGKKKWAVVGATPNEEKTGNRIVKRLLIHDYEVYPINPNYDEIEGMKSYKDIDSLPEVPDCIDFVVPPAVTMKSIEQLDPKKIQYLWFQPGSYEDETVKYAEKKGFKVVHEGACVMMALEVVEEI